MSGGTAEDAPSGAATADEAATPPTIETRDLRKYFRSSSGLLSRLRGGGTPVRAVDDVSIRIEPGEVYGLVGESGSGKTTLGETILRLQEPTGGEIRYMGRPINDYSGEELRQFRREAQLIFQDPYECLNPRHTVFQTVAGPLKNFYDYDHEELEGRVVEALDDVGLRPPESFLDTYPEQLSGGQRQRVNIARALVLEPNFIVADEPVSMLDISIQSSILRLLDDLQREIGFSLLFISHNLAIVRLVADRIGVMYRGRIVEEGDADRILREPKHPYTQLLVDSVPDPGSERRGRAAARDVEVADQESVTGCRFHPHCPERFEPCPKRSPALAEVDGGKVACYLYHDEDRPDD